MYEVHTMANKKMSYVVAVESAINGELTPEVVERLEALKASLEKRNTHKSNGPTKAQKERIELAEKVFGAMVAGESYTSHGIAGLIPELEGASSQKVTALMKTLGERVTSEKVKGKAVYKIA